MCMKPARYPHEPSIILYQLREHAQITTIRLSPATVNNAIMGGSSERLDHPNTFRFVSQTFTVPFQTNGSMSAQQNQGWCWLGKDYKSPKTHTHSPFRCPRTPTPTPPASFSPFFLIFCLWLSVMHIPGCKAILTQKSVKGTNTTKQSCEGSRPGCILTAALPINTECTFQQANTLETK